MKLINTTNIPNERVRELIRFSKPNGVKNVDVAVRNTGYLHWGRSYSSNYVAVFVCKHDKLFPWYHEVFPNHKKRGYLSQKWILDREEALVGILAHELRHQWQHNHKGHRCFGCRKKGSSERDADAYAIKKIREWRKRQERPTVPIYF